MWTSDEAQRIDREWLEQYRTEDYQPKRAEIGAGVEPPLEPAANQQNQQNNDKADRDRDYSSPAPPRLPQQQPALVTDHELNISWKQYFERLQRNETRRNYRLFSAPGGGDPAVDQLEAQWSAFEKSESLTDMSRDERQTIGGFGSSPTLWFGSMEGAGTFKSMLNDTPERLDEPLREYIPYAGPISIENVGNYLDEILDIHYLGVSTASRLLFAKRPDVFVCVNSANQTGLKKSFKLRPQTRDGYLELHRILWSFPWAQSSEPDDSSREKTAWRARTALLDTFYYDWTDTA